MRVTYNKFLLLFCRVTFYHINICLLSQKNPLQIRSDAHITAPTPSNSLQLISHSFIPFQEKIDKQESVCTLPNVTR